MNRRRNGERAVPMMPAAERAWDATSGLLQIVRPARLSADALRKVIVLRARAERWLYDAGCLSIEHRSLDGMQLVMSSRVRIGSGSFRTVGEAVDVATDVFNDCNSSVFDPMPNVPVNNGWITGIRRRYVVLQFDTPDLRAEREVIQEAWPQEVRDARLRMPSAPMTAFTGSGASVAKDIINLIDRVAPQISFNFEPAVYDYRPDRMV